MNTHEGIYLQGTLFHNTVPLEGPDLRDALIVALTQTNIIAEMYHVWPEMSPSQVWQRYAGFRTNNLGEKFAATPPVTSIRRAINTLMREGILEKTDKKVAGLYGMKENVWKLKKL